MTSTGHSLQERRRAILSDLGGSRVVSEGLETPRSTVDNWPSLGFPAIRLTQLFKFARSRGVPLTMDELIELSTARRNGG